MTNYRTLDLAEYHLVVTNKVPGVYVVRIHPDPETPYVGGTTVFEEDDGETLYLELMLGLHLSHNEWCKAAKHFFPRAKTAKWFRRNLITGKDRLVKVSLN